MDGTGDTVYDIEGKAMRFGGIVVMLEEKYKDTESEYVQKEIEAYMRVLTCPSCQGKRLRPEALAVKVADKSIADIVSVPLDDTVAFLKDLAAVP
jgi:excinuclease ABC subunit A